MPCVDCGASVAWTEREVHRSSRERRLDFAVFQLREELEQFDKAFMDYLETPRGRFEVWYAAPPSVSLEVTERPSVMMARCC
jgi:hypothetical protein